MSQSQETINALTAEAMKDLKESIARLEDKVDKGFETVIAHQTMQNGKVQKHELSISTLQAIAKEYTEHDTDKETRIRWIENNIWKFIGLMMIVPPIVTIGIGWLLSLVR